MVQSSLSPVLVGREGPLATLEDSLLRARRGEGPGQSVGSGT